MSVKDIPWIKAHSGSLTIYCNKKVLTVPPDHQHYNEIMKALKSGDVDEVVRLADISKAVQSYVNGKVRVEDGVVFYENQEVHNAVVTRILNLQRDGFPFGYMALFLENLMQNPSFRAVQELYDFLAHRNLPITDNGNFLAYKRVRDDWTDFHTGTILNTVGTVVEVPRNMVDDERENACSNGLHVGAIEYVRGFNAGSGHIVICEVNPADVVSVPKDCNCTKLRTCRYKVVEEYTGDLTSSVYNTAHGVAPVNPGNAGEDGEYKDDEYADGDDEAETLGW